MSISKAVVGIAAGAVMQGHKMLKRLQNDKETVQRMLESNEGNKIHELKEALQVLACILKGVYLRCSQERSPYFEDIKQHWERWDYKAVEFQNLPGASEKDRRLVGDLGNPRDQCVRVVLFERPKHQAPRHVCMRVEGAPDQFILEKLPKYLLAIRGTILPRKNDIKRDLQIAGEVLHLAEKLHEPVKRLMRAIIRKYGFKDIWVAGHSLGAALALIATRSLAIEDDIVINTHLFNPPYLTADVLASKAMRGVLNGLGDLGNKTLHSFGMQNSWNIRAGTDKVANKCKNQMRRWSSLGRRIANSDYGEDMENEAQKLLRIGYVPNLYVNPKDTICNEYIKHFQRRPHVNTSVVSEVIQWVVPAKSVHMIPLAVVYVNHWGEGPLEAHKLYQWFIYPYVNLTVERQGRTADQSSSGPSNSNGS